LHNLLQFRIDLVLDAVDWELQPVLVEKGFEILLLLTRESSLDNMLLDEIILLLDLLHNESEFAVHRFTRTTFCVQLVF